MRYETRALTPAGAAPDACRLQQPRIDDPVRGLARELAQLMGFRLGGGKNVPHRHTANEKDIGQ